MIRTMRHKSNPQTFYPISLDPGEPGTSLCGEDEGPPSGAPYPCRKEKETHEWIFSCLSYAWLVVLHHIDVVVNQHLLNQAIH